MLIVKINGKVLNYNRTVKTLLELTETVRQQGDSHLTDLLNNVCTTDINPSDIDLLESRIKQQQEDADPYGVLHIFTEN